ncbi:MAG TPA: NfeD family protein [Candidatus Dormibacteraeota bacterium]|jgi:membrane protein implicated in regulation of membrane protease activity|nr:NfeD family protein [Candidatus Dormibacteraeota bacterium]
MSLLQSMFFGLWVAMVVAFVALEVHTQAFYALFVALGAAAAAAVALLSGSLWIQGVLFAFVTVGGWLLVRPVLRSRFDRSAPIAKFRGIAGSADGLVGQPAITLDTVGDEHHPGHALFAGDRWLAISDTADPLPAQVPVVVVAVRGTTLLVRPAT